MLRSVIVALAHQNIQIGKFPKRNVAIDRSGQNRAFIRDGGYMVPFEQTQDF